jgi:hypothetical protein
LETKIDLSFLAPRHSTSLRQGSCAARLISLILLFLSPFCSGTKAMVNEDYNAQGKLVIVRDADTSPPKKKQVL